MTRIRILLVALPSMLGDILGEAIARRSDMDVVGRARAVAEAAPLMLQLQPHAIIVGSTDDNAAAVAGELRQIAPTVTVVAILARGEQARVFTALGQAVLLTDIAVDTLLDTIRDHTAVKGSTRLPPA